jgi:predicted lipoprotein
MAKMLKIIAIVLACVFLLYHSIYFEKQSTRPNERAQAFDQQTYVSNFWNTLQSLENHVDVDALLPLLISDKQKAIAQYGKTLGVSSNHSFFVHGRGTVSVINDDSILLVSQSGVSISIQTDYIFGNEVRDASGLVSVSDFPSTMEFNAISSEINKRVARQVLPAFLDKVKSGDTLYFVGAGTVHEDEPQIDPFRIVPIKLEFLD